MQCPSLPTILAKGFRSLCICASVKHWPLLSLYKQLNLRLDNVLGYISVAWSYMHVPYNGKLWQWATEVKIFSWPLVAQHCLGAVVPPLDVVISHNGGPFVAGLSYNLTCTVTLENVAGPPTVEWFDPIKNSPTITDGITVGDTLLAYCSTYTTTLHFTTLRTSHGGQYSCQATLGTTNNTAAINITVLSKSILLFYVVMVLASFVSVFTVVCSSSSECDYYK